MTDSIKCISLWDPYATLCVVTSKDDKTRALKPYETRSWSTSYRGTLLIHAAKRFTRAQSDLCFQEPFMSALMECGVMKRNGDSRVELTLSPGCIIGQVKVVDVYQVQEWDIETPNGTKLISMARQVLPYFWETGKLIPVPTGNELAFGDFTVGRYAWKLDNPVRFAKPIPFPGRQQIFKVPREVVAEQLATHCGVTVDHPGVT